MKKTNVSTLKNRLSAYLRQVKRGKQFVVMERTTPVAMLSPIAAGELTEDSSLNHAVADGIMTSGNPALLTHFDWPTGPRRGSVLATLLAEREED